MILIEINVINNIKTINLFSTKLMTVTKNLQKLKGASKKLK